MLLFMKRIYKVEKVFSCTLFYTLVIWRLLATEEVTTKYLKQSIVAISDRCICQSVQPQKGSDVLDINI